MSNQDFSGTGKVRFSNKHAMPPATAVQKQHLLAKERSFMATDSKKVADVLAAAQRDWEQRPELRAMFGVQTWSTDAEREAAFKRYLRAAGREANVEITGNIHGTDRPPDALGSVFHGDPK